MLVSGCGSSKSASSKNEQLALDFINNFINSSDAKAKQTFLEENIHPDIQALFQLGLGTEPSEDSIYVNAKVAKSAKYKTDDVNGDIVLITADNNKEGIVLLIDDKISFLFSPEATATKEAYDAMTEQLK